MVFTLKKFAVSLAVAGSLLLTACGPAGGDPNHIKVGISAGIDQQVWSVVQKVAKEKYNLDVEVVTFNDFVLPNEALNNGDLDINAFQHKPYLDKQIQERGYKLVAVGNTFVYPIAAYSKQITAIDQLPDGAQVAVPNDPTNLGRSLLLLQKQGLITLKEGTGLLPTALDIVNNPKRLKIVEIEAPQLTRALDDRQISLAVINTTFSSQVGLSPSRNGLFVEDRHSPYVNIFASRVDNQDSEKVKNLVKAYQTDEVAAAAAELYKGDAVKGW
ncbi:methionine ABC transporter substrate-binding lipoprotein MetQ [Raoultella sp. Ech2A]|jgi:D-methionine transport system substrate-binding protein|uniref:methionine ABC transporter substrate-binding lipoprotein MetQ n=1 Tax=Raoultella sp. Ech2A TaxID=2996539 RepID=UPI0024C0774B|nr:methionine ABC transporter substrate-binding lipoprotein MetQ [Raoultella sp. Ech2A]MDJ1654628.1 methionine ABC transporter substrate-binding lipoprotein MetQ [Raoultella sp. Ech2A]